ncbi:flagellar biosynthesis protein FlhB [Patulibacter minatonensis]|uniref:flagellar biosynthesis protein FlhB n=1 Tax=Patulibacter minatonensis TaxID=298163 RepID=UPI00047C4379|nr:flagellar biosynthesis protein FlhB [Patulibacter minatonensis]
MSDDKTEKATPKRENEAREKGQVARSTDLNGAVVLLVGLSVLAMLGPRMVAEMKTMMTDGFVLAGHPDAMDSQEDVVSLGGELTRWFVALLAPLAFAIALAAVVANLGQVGVKLTPKALKPDMKRLNPIQGFKNVFGPNALVEGTKSLVKLAVVAGVVAVAVLPRIDEIATTTGMDPQVLLATMGSDVKGIALRAAAVYLLIGAADVFWQKHRHAKSMRMSMQDVKMEHKQEELPPEVRAQMRRRQHEASRGRMMAAVPTADVVIMNPTHFAVALSYDPTRIAPTVVAKGQDLVALRIRDLARESGVHVTENPPLARALHRQVDVGHAIPEELFQAVAEVLAHVYRVSRRHQRTTA